MIMCNRRFYSLARILGRVGSALRERRRPRLSFVGNLSYRNNCRADRQAYADFERQPRHFSGINRMQLQTQA
jgi:hypothetical protein